MDWENNLRKKSDPKKIEKTVKVRVKLPHVNKRPVAKKQIFVQTPFSHSNLKSEQKNSRRRATLFLAPFPASAWPKSLLQFDFTQIVKMCEQIKKRQRPNTIQIL